MKIKKETVNKNLLDCLLTIQRDPLFNDFFLVGGTALSLQIGHRISEDIDLFTNNKVNKENILLFMRNNISKDIEIENSSKSILQIYSENMSLKIDFVEFPYKPIDPLIEEEGIKLIGLNDISAMKMSATGTRGTQAKDYVDIYYLLKYMTIDKIVENFKNLYKTDDVLHYIRSMMYFDDVDEASWKALKPTDKNFSKNDVMHIITREVSSYQRRKLESKIK